MKTLTITFLLTFLLTIGTANSDVTPVTDRTQAVQDAIVAAVPNIDAAADVTETHLTAITDLNLRNKGITELKSGDFSGMTALTNLNLYNNLLSKLPEGIFKGLTALTTLRLGSNAVDPMPLIVRIEKNEDEQFKAVISTGAPFDITLPINTTNNGVTSEATTITIPIGNVESALFTVTTANPSGTPIVAIGTLPGLPRNHYGYTFALSTACHRTLQVRRAIVAAVPGVDDCRYVTDAHLAAIQTLNLEYAEISTLRSDDFSGLTSLSTLYLGNNNLTTLPADIFSGLSSLTALYIQNNKLNSLPENVFSSLSSIRQLNLHSNQLTSLPKNLFSGLKSLTQIFLNDNKLTTLDPDIFSNVSTLKYLYLNNNSLTTLPENLFSDITSLEQLLLNNNRLGNLPPGIFRGMSTPTLLWIHNNSVLTLPLTVSLEKVGEGEFKVVVPTGTPIDIDLKFTVTNGMLNSDSNLLTLTAGNVESDSITVTQTAGSSDAVTVDIEILSELPEYHLGYEPVKSADLPLIVVDKPNVAPVFAGGESITRSVSENTSANVNIGTAITATDADNDTLTYTRGGTDETSFEIDSATGQLKTKVTLDYETKNTYSVTITVSDGSLTDTINVTINVTDIDETIPNRAPVFTEGGSTARIVAENTDAGVNFGAAVAATDPDGNTLAYTIGGTDATAFEIDGAMGQLNTKAELDYETKNAYSVTITVSDGSLTDTINVNINVNDANDAPVFTERDATTRTVAENAAAGIHIGTPIIATDADGNILTYTLGGTDVAFFEVDNTIGQLKTKTILDYESQSSYKITVIVSDGSLSDTIDVTINVTDIDETTPNRAPVFTEGGSTTRTVEENTEAGANIGTAIAATDPDGNTLTYTLGGTDAASFVIEVATGQLKTKETLDYETKNSYSITVTVSDGSLTDTIAGTINITDANEAPVFTDGNATTRSVAENLEVGVNIGTAIAATDPDGNTLTYTLGGPDAASFDIDSSTGQLKTKTTLDRESQSTYTVTITVSDSSITNIIVVTINVSNVNEVPVFTEGDSTTRTVAEKTLEGVEIGTAIGATDPDGDTLTYTLSGADADIFELESTTGQLKTKKILDFETQFTYKVTLTVSDGKLSDTIDVTITVIDIDETIPNRAPVFTDGENTTRSVAENTSADENIGTPVEATDADGNTLNYTLGGTDAASFAIEAATGQVKTKDTLDYETKNTYSVTITVSDGSLTDTINVTINITDIVETIPNRAPVFTEGETTTRAVAENTIADTNIGAAVAATDPDGNTLTYTLGGTDAATFDIDSTSGQLKTKDTLDYETKNTYSVTITASDGSLTDTINVTINVTDIVETIPNRAPVFTEGETTTRAVAENTIADTNIGAAVAATDPDGNTLTYILGGTDAATFDIDSTNGRLKTKDTLNYEDKSAYSVTITVSDGDLTDVINVNINVTNQNDAPIFTEGNSATRAVAENTIADTNIGAAVAATDPDGNTLTYTLGGTDAATFDIDSTSGQLKTKDTLNYEDKSAYSVTITASDGDLTDVINVNINVTNQNDAPIFTEGNSATRAVAENTIADTNIGAAVAATDPDGNTLTYTLGGTDAATFDIDSTNGQLKTKDTLNYEDKSAYSVTITASDGDITDTINVTITVTDIEETIPNRAPVFTEGETATRAVAENTIADTNIGTAVIATDADNDTLAYTLSGTNATSFAIVGTSGQLKTSATLDFETKSSYSVMVSVSDGKGGTDSINVTINVTDVTENRAPVFTDGETTTRAVAENTDADTEIGDAVAATDADNDTLTYTLGGTDAASFAIISTSGQLKTSVTLDFETKSSYSVTVSVSDDNGGSDSISVTITVTDIDESTTETTFTSVCDRTPQVRDAIVAAAGVNSCEEVTEEHLKQIRVLDLDRSSITSLKSDDFDGLSSMESLKLIAFDLTSLPGDIFDENTALTTLQLFVKDLTSLPDSIFDELTALTSLSLNVNKLSSLPDGIFDELTALKYLYLIANDLSSLPDGIFDELTALTELTLSAIALRLSPEGIFDENTALKYLNLSGNDLSYLPDDMFDELTALTELRLSHNDLSSLPDGIFDKLTALTVLILKTNDLTSLPDGIFDENTALTHLSLGGNDLSSLQVDIFDENTALTWLSLSGNDLSSLQADIFDENIALIWLHLNDNDLSSLPDGIFDENTALIELNLNDNELSSLPDGIFDGLTKLGPLSLSGNTVDPLPLTVSLEKVSDGQFKAVAPIGAPFNIVLPLTVANGSISGATSVTISTGKVVSDTLTVTRTSGTTGAVTVDIGTLPSIPSSHNGYSLVKSDNLPLTIITGTTVTNAAPVFTEGTSTSRTVAENTAADTNIGAAVAATDPDGNTLTYILGGTDAATFDIISTSGQLKTSVTLDFETKSSYSVTVSVSDDNGGSDSISVTITVTDIDESTTETTFTSVCDRTPQVRDAIVAAADVDDCSAVTEEHLKVIRILNLNYSSITSLKSGDFDGLSLTTLNMRHTELSSLPSGIFDELTTLRVLNLSGNELSSLPSGIFDELTALGYIFLNDNELSSLPSGIFDENTALVNLNLGGNELSSLPSGIFDELTALTTLTLRDNELSSLPSGIFDENTALVNLNLGGNELSSLPSGIFDELTALVSLSLSGNDLSSLPDGIFDELTTLTDLALYYNDLSPMLDGIFDELTALTTLNLGGNGISPLPDGIFDELTALTRLYLYSNDLSSLPSGMFDELTTLTTLGLGDNDLSSLPDGIFDENTALTRLDLYSNDLSSLPDGIFDENTALTYLDLSGNHLNSLQADIFDELTALQSLYLSANGISSLPEGIFDELTALTTLHLGSNRVNPLSLTVSMEKVSDGQFKAVVPTGAPFDIVLPLTVANGSISGSATSVTISIGAVESDTLTVTRTSGTTGAVTVDIGTLPSIPSSHNGYALVKPTTGLPLEVIATVGGAPTSVSNSAPQVPEVTAVMPNYPNPFNPETWIPYQLAKSADVSLTFYNIHGVVVRRLVLGHRAAGVYYSRSRAAHWDGRNNIGEKVATGTYFCTFTAGDFITTRKMVIRK